MVSFVAASARGSEDGHATAEHPGHGEGHSEIGANPPPGVEREDFESPAEIRGDLAIWSFAVFLLLMVLLTAVAWKPIMNGLDAREQSIAEMVAATQKAHDDAKNNCLLMSNALPKPQKKSKPCSTKQGEMLKSHGNQLFPMHDKQLMKKSNELKEK